MLFEEWRARREASLRNPYGWLSLVGLHWLNDDPSTFDGVPGRWRATKTGAILVAVVADGLTQGEQVLLGEHEIEAEQRVRQGELEIQVIERGNSMALRVRDPHSPLLTGFQGVPAYPYDEKWVIEGQFTPSLAAIEVASVVDGLTQDETQAGIVEFGVDGVRHRLTAFDDGDGEISLLFRDATSGVTTYPAMRNLDLGVPGPDGAIVLDFNRATNMPCAFTDHGTCPLPPRENVLAIAVEAGEMDPRTHG